MIRTMLSARLSISVGRVTQMTRTILLLALVVLLTAAIYIIKDICKAEPVTVAATDDWLSLDTWHWHEETIDCVSYTVGNGDTLWSIANRYYPDEHTGEMVWAIRKAMSWKSGGPVLQPGQVLWIPDPAIYGWKGGDDESLYERKIQKELYEL